MPSNQCTNSLTELSFAVGNMIGAQQCDVEDWRQIRDQLASWECSTRGAAGDAIDVMSDTVTDAIRHCGLKPGCLEADCVGLFEAHEELAQALNLYTPEHIGRGIRGAVPPKIKGNETLGRKMTLAEQRTSELARKRAREVAKEARKVGEATLRTQLATAAKKAAEEAAKGSQEGEGLPRTGTEGNRYSISPSREMDRLQYGNGERRERWYPARA